MELKPSNPSNWPQTGQIVLKPCAEQAQVPRSPASCWDSFCRSSSAWRSTSANRSSRALRFYTDRHSQVKNTYTKWILHWTQHAPYFVEKVSRRVPKYGTKPGHLGDLTSIFCTVYGILGHVLYRSLSNTWRCSQMKLLCLLRSGLTKTASVRFRP